jgi:hypothetical protein
MVGVILNKRRQFAAVYFRYSLLITISSAKSDRSFPTAGSFNVSARM